MSATLEQLSESGRRNWRNITYWSGTWDLLSKQIPQFEKRDFQTSADATSNPYMQTIVRLPRLEEEWPIPVAAVSNFYTLAQHHDVAKRCLEGIQDVGISTKEIRCELGLTDLGEWMNFRIYFPEQYDYTPEDGQSLGLRLECFNSVDASSRLSLFLGWFRFICSNGLIIGRTKAELSDIHGRHMQLDRISAMISEGLDDAQADIDRLDGWQASEIGLDRLEQWANKELTSKWGKNAACRVYHICCSGYDIEISNPFVAAKATEKPVKQTQAVPGAAQLACNLYDVSQALSWVSGSRKNPEERVARQSEIPDLVDQLRETA